MRVALVIGLVLSFAASSVWAGSCTSKATGSWNGGTATTWNAGCTGAGGSPAAADTVTISSGHTVTVAANAAATSVTLANGNNTILTINAGFNLTTSGDVIFSTTSNTRTRRIQVLAGAQLNVGGDLSLTNGSSAGAVADVQIGNGANTSVTVSGDITFNTTVAGSITFQGAGTLNVAGDFINGVTFTPAQGTVVYNGTGAQNLGNYTYNVLTISKTGGTATATGNVVAAALNFAAANAGLVSMTTGTLTVTGSCLTTPTRTGNGHVIGNLELTFPSGNPTCTYFIGDASNYTPMTVAFTGSGGGTLTGDVTKADHPQKAFWTLSTTKYVQRYFTLGATGDTLATFTSYDATLTWVAGDIQGGASSASFMVAAYRSGWVVPDPAFSGGTATSIVVNDVTAAFSTPIDFAVGEPYVCAPPSNAPAGVVCQCDNFGRSALNPSTIFGANWLLSTSNGSFGIPKIVTQGLLRLTDSTNDNANAATVPGIFPAAGNYISVEFKQYAYSGSGADGIAVTLSDYSVAPTPGAFGGSLGYAQKPGINGFAGGWVGVALDEFGNYENNTESRSGNAAGCGLCPDSVGVRGSGSGTTGYPWLAGNTTAGGIDQAGATAGPGNMYQIIVDARNYTPTNKTALVSVNRDSTTKTGANYTAVVAPFDAYVVNASQAVVPVNWQISFTGSTGGSTNIHEIGALKVCAQTMIAPTGSSAAAGFNAIDSALPNTKPNALFGHIYMKIANVPFTLNVAALAPPVGGVSQGVNTAYASSGSKTVTVKLFDDSQAGTSCNSSASACTACAKTVVATQTMTFTSGDAGFKTSPAFTVNAGYKRLIVQMNDGTTTGCSTDAFSIRPAFYALTSSVAAPTKAGTQFTITATPKNPSNTTITSPTGSPTLDNTKAPVAGGNQTLLQQSWATGASFGTFIYNDVGTFSLAANAVYDRQFGNSAGEAQDQTNGDCNPGSGTTYVPNVCYGYSGASCTNATPWAVDSSGKYGCDIGAAALSNVGRYYPDHYETSLAMTQACSANGFSYMGQQFSMTASPSGLITVKALAAGQTFTTGPGLPSFSTGYSPLATVWFGAQNGTGSTTDLIKCISSTLNTTANRCALTTLPTKSVPSSSWSAGIYTAPATTFFFDPPKDATTTPDSTWGPYDNLNVGITVSDSDGSTLTVPASPTFTLNGDTYRAINATTAKVRYGRMRIQNGSGSDQVAMVMPVFLEYWSGSGWSLNALDTACTSLVASPSAFGGNTAASSCYGTGCTSVSAGSVGSLYETRVKGVAANLPTPSYSSPTFSFGQRNVLLAAPKASGTIGISIEAPTWLKIGPVDPTGVNPSATLRFGTYNSRFIFLRENY
jgi:MSHA biogenesis protein MshQ